MGLPEQTASYPFKGNNKGLHPKYYNTRKTMLYTVIWADKMGWFLADYLVHQVKIKTKKLF